MPGGRRVERRAWPTIATEELAEVVTLRRSTYDVVSEPISGAIIRYDLSNNTSELCFVRTGDSAAMTYEDYLAYRNRYFDAEVEDFMIATAVHNRTLTADEETRSDDKYGWKTVEPKLDDNTEIKLYTGEKALYKDCVKIRSLGYCLKTDKNLQEDYITKELIFVNEEYSRKLYQQFSTVFKEIDAKGNLSNPSYTAMFPNLPTLVYNDALKDKLTIYHYCTMELLENAKFNYFFRENINDGKFYAKGEIREKDLVKSPRAQYRKAKRYLSFAKSMVNKPNTYVKMLGKRYSFGRRKIS